MKKLLFSVISLITSFNYGQNTITSKDGVKYIDDKGWIIIEILDTTFSATFMDDFSSNESIENWELYDDNNGTYSKIENERLQIKLAGKGGRMRTILTKVPMSLTDNNFDITAIFDANSTSLYQGIVFGYEDGRSYSSVSISPSYNRMVYEKNDDGIVSAEEVIEDSYLLPDRDNELRIKKEIGVISVYLNGKKAYEIPESKLSGDGIGIIAGGTSEMPTGLTKMIKINILLPDEIFSINNPQVKRNVVKIKKSNGVYAVPVEINRVLKIDFIFDSGASDVSISSDIASTLIKTGTIKKEDWLPGGYYKLADGTIAKSKRFKIRSIKIGNKIVKNVTCSITNSSEAPMLLGQSILKNFGKYTFDYKNQILILD